MDSSASGEGQAGRKPDYQPITFWELIGGTADHQLITGMSVLGMFVAVMVTLRLAGGRERDDYDYDYEGYDYPRRRKRARRRRRRLLRW